MADLRCPMCGKPNSEELEICQFCQARLKPLHGQYSAEGSMTSPASEPSREFDGDQDSMDEWLSFLRQNDEQDESPHLDEEQFSDWVNEGLDNESAESPAISPEADGTPDWLSSLRNYSTEDMPPIPESEKNQSEPEVFPTGDTADENEVPDWLSKLRSRRIAEEGEADEEAPVIDQSLLPDLVEEELPARREAGDETQQTDVARGGLGEETEAEVEIGEVSASETEGVNRIEEIQPQTEEIPDWLAGIVAGGAGATTAEGAEADLENLPEWLADLEKASALDRDEIVPFGEEGDELTFDWLQTQVSAGQELPYSEDLSSESLGMDSDNQTVGPFVGDLSDFLEEAELSSLDVTQPETEKPGADLSPADLPTWLEAMRPVDAAAGIYALDALDAQVESSGPLAGLQGVLPAEPEIARLKKPAVYALRLQVTENQRAHADLFEGLVKSEGEPKEIVGRPAVSSPYIFRLIIFAVLILVVLWPILTGSQTSPLPGLIPGTFDSSEIINNLPGSPLVLLAVDYDPALMGEMEAAAAPMVDHLMLKGAYISLVSTSTTGPALGEHLIASVGSLSGHQYQGIDAYANLGYIPGGASGLLGFAQAPRQVTPFALDPETTDIWNETPLQTVQNLAGFNLVAVVTDDSDKARAWVEQVQPALNGTPLIMVVSTQSEPMIRPYYQANPKQIDGMIVGLAGGGAYEQSHQNLLKGDGPARKYWDAFSLGVLAAVVLIAVGGFVNLVTNLLNAQRQSKVDKKR